MTDALRPMAAEVDRGGHGVEGDRLFHAAVTDAIAARRPRQAATAMRRHVRTVAKVRLLDREPAQDR